MGVKVKGGQFCPTCNRTVAAQKSTHRLRNIAATITLPATFGASGLAYTSDGWHCPSCGGPVYDIASAQKKQRNAELNAMPVKDLPLSEKFYLAFGCVLALGALGAIVDAIF